MSHDPPMGHDAPILPVASERSRRTRSHRSGAVAIVAAAAVAALAWGCADVPVPSSPADLWTGRLAVLSAVDGRATIEIHGPTGDPSPLALPWADASWLAADGVGRLVLTLPDGSIVRSGGQLGDPAAGWLPVAYEPPSPAGPVAFAVPHPNGGRIAAISGRLGTGEPSSVLLIDPTTGGSLAIDLGHEAHGWAPAWLGPDRLAVIVLGTSGAPSVALVDPATSAVAEGPVGVGGIATSADGSRVATLGADGRSLHLWAIDRWPGTGADSSERLARITPPDTGVAAAMAFDARGETLAVVWTDDALVPRWIGLYRSVRDWAEVGRIETGLDRARAAVAWLP